MVFELTSWVSLFETAVVIESWIVSVNLIVTSFLIWKLYLTPDATSIVSIAGPASCLLPRRSSMRRWYLYA